MNRVANVAFDDQVLAAIDDRGSFRDEAQLALYLNGREERAGELSSAQRVYKALRRLERRRLICQTRSWGIRRYDVRLVGAQLSFDIEIAEQTVGLAEKAFTRAQRRLERLRAQRRGLS